MQPRAIPVALAVAFSAIAAHAGAVDFEDMPAGFTTPQPSTFVSNGVEFFVDPFLDLDAGEVDIAFSSATNTGFDIEANVRNARLGIDFMDNFGESAQAITLFYGSSVGEAAVFINGFTNGTVSNLLELDGASFGGAVISVFPTGPGSGRLSVDGVMNTFAIAGENIWIDDIRSPSIPAPGVFALAGMAGLASLRRRRSV